MTETYYKTLGLAPSAPLAVIKASYKALVLIHHPDKTLRLLPEERAHHCTLFREIQQAYDVLSNANLKAAYDAELEHRDLKVDLERSISHPRANSSCRRDSYPSVSKRHVSVLTTPEEKRAWRAKIDTEFARIQEEREKREQEEDSLSLSDLKMTLRLWVEMADERQDRATDRAYCAIEIRKLEQKIQHRQLQQDEWLNKMSTPKYPSTPTSETRPHTSRSPTPRSSAQKTPTSRQQQRTEVRRHTEELRTTEEAARARARAEERARRGEAKQAHLDAKAAAVRAEKEILRRKGHEAAAKDAERIAKARAKAAPMGHVTPDTRSTVSTPIKPGVKKPCGKCKEEHASLAEWKRCAKSTTDEAVENDVFWHVI